MVKTTHIRIKKTTKRKFEKAKAEGVSFDKFLNKMFRDQAKRREQAFKEQAERLKKNEKKK